MGDFSHSNVDSRLDSVREMSSHDQEDDTLDLRFIVVGKKCKSNPDLEKALKFYECPVIYSDTGLEHINDAENDTVFVLDNFEGDIFTRLHRAKCRIMGPSVIIHCSNNQQRLPNNSRPLYCMLMHRLILCFTGFRVKEDLSRLADLVHHMGGSIRRDFSSRVTHLVANCTGGEKYRVAVSMGTSIMTEDWVHRAWELREDVAKTAMDESLMEYKMSPFFFSILAFLGFSREEQREMERTTVEYGGSVVEAGSPQCTHLVVDEHNVKQNQFETHPRLHVIKQEWFWASIQMDACADESMYTYEVPNMTPSLPATKSTPKTLSAGSKSRKRKRLRENLAQLAHEGEVDTPMYKRRSSEITHMSISASFLDDTKSPNISDTLSQDPLREARGSASSPSSQSAPAVRFTPRQQTVMEFFQTEKNYAGILHTIIKTFKEEIEKPDQPGGPLLDPTDVKMIFGKIPPLFDVHMKIRDELSEMVTDWHEDYLIGDIILKHADALIRSYPPFVNFFESTKQTLEKCDKEKPRFHAFLKVCQSKAECGRQTLKELLIRPVQRLPSVMLLIKDIMKRTDPSHPDHAQLDKAIKALEEVMTHINEDKRKTEGHQVMFDIVNDIENCPPNLLSSHRKFITKLDVVELTSELSGKGDHITLFVFSDSLEMCKRRVKVLNSKSPGGHGSKTPQKAYKHIDVLQLSSIKRVLDIVETPECKNVFALVTKKMSEAEKLYAFVIMDETEKVPMLETLSKTICQSTCRTDFATLQATVDAQTLNLDTTDLAVSGNRTLSKAATRFGKRVSRAFSFNKTPRKLKRAMSSMTQMMSPFTRRESGVYQPGGATPGGARSNMTAMRLASVNDLTDESSFNENLYSDLVDSVSLGCRTPAMSRRRDTLAELDEMSMNSSQFTSMSDISAFPPPPVPSTINHRRETLAGVSETDILLAVNGEKPQRKRQKRLSVMLSGDTTPTCTKPRAPSTPKSATFGFRSGSKFL